MNYYHVTYGSFQSPEIDADWLDREGWHNVFCKGCGTRLPGIKALDVQLSAETMPFALASFGCPDVCIVKKNLLDALGIDLNRYLRLGKVIGKKGKVIPDTYTIMSTLKMVPIRARRPLESVGCTICKQPVFIALPSHDRYVVSRKGLTEPVYESNENNLIVREDVCERIRPVVGKRVRIEKLAIEQHGFDGRSEPELEY